MSFRKNETIRLALGEARVIPHLGKLLASEHCNLILPILCFFENRKEYYPQLLSIGLASLARVFLKCEPLLKSKLKLPGAEIEEEEARGGSMNSRAVSHMQTSMLPGES
jgi:hypothetical protein